MKKQKFSKKLSLNKESITSLNSNQQQNVKGGTQATSMICAYKTQCCGVQTSMICPAITYCCETEDTCQTEDKTCKC